MNAMRRASLQSARFLNTHAPQLMIVVLVEHDRMIERLAPYRTRTQQSQIFRVAPAPHAAQGPSH